MTILKKSMTASRVVVHVLALVSILGLIYAFPVSAQEKAKSTLSGSLVYVNSVEAQVLSQTVPIIGRLVAKRAGNVSSRIEGYIDQYLVDVGDSVEKGDIIAVLNTDVLKAQLALAKSEAKEAQANLKAAQARAQLARQSLKRYTSVRNSPAYSRARVEDQQQNLKEAVANISQARATIEAKEAIERVRQLDVAFANIRAPFSGVITRKPLSAGSYANVGTAVAYLVSDRTLEIEADVPFQRVDGLTSGTEVSFSLDDGSSHKARVRAVLPAENPTTRTRTVRFVPVFNGVRTKLANEQSAKINVPLSVQRKVITVHKDAILQRGGGSVVFLVDEGKAKLARVTLGESVGNRIEVLAGLKIGDQAIVRGNERLRPGAPVRLNGLKSGAKNKSAGAPK